MNCCVPFTPTVAISGVTAIETSVGAALVPVPDSITVCGLPCAESVIVRFPLNAVALVGVNVTMIAQLICPLPPTGTNPPEETQLSVSANPTGAIILGIVTVVFPVLVIVTVCGALVVFTAWFPKDKDVGAMVIVFVAPPSRPTVCVPLFWALSVIVSKPDSGGVTIGFAVHVIEIVQEFAG